MVISMTGSILPKVVSQISPSCKKLLTSQRNSHYVPGFILISSRSITGKTLRDPDAKRPPPFPYRNRRYTLFHRLFDNTKHRFDENSKIIVVDGAVAAGKTAFAKELAEDLDMHYMPEASMDTIYINPYGYDMRELDPKLPASIRSYDPRNFCQNPNHPNAAFLQIMLYQLKCSSYIDALAHLFNTGQGVVLDKSPYSDFVYAEAMAKEGFISKVAKSVYYDVKRHTIDDLLKPHLCIYLDVPVEKIQQKIKERGRPEEQNSKALSSSFLAALEDNYKRQYLKEMSAHSELLIYDWSDGGDVEVVVEDIERIDFDKYTVYDEKLKNWRFPNISDLCDARVMYTNNKGRLMSKFNVPRFDCPELVIDGMDVKKFHEVWWTAPGSEFAPGYNAKMGDTGIIWKMFQQNKWNYF